MVEQVESWRRFSALTQDINTASSRRTFPDHAPQAPLKLLWFLQTPLNQPYRGRANFLDVCLRNERPQNKLDLRALVRIRSELGVIQ